MDSNISVTNFTLKSGTVEWTLTHHHYEVAHSIFNLALTLVKFTLINKSKLQTSYVQKLLWDSQACNFNSHANALQNLPVRRKLKSMEGASISHSTSLKRTCHHFDELFFAGYKSSYQDNFRCRQWKDASKTFSFPAMGIEIETEIPESNTQNPPVTSIAFTQAPLDHSWVIDWFHRCGCP